MKNYLKIFLLITFCFSFSCSFSQQNTDTAKTNKEVLNALNGYIAALKELNLSKTISYYSNTKDFLIYDNGKAWNYDEFTDALKNTFSQLKKATVSYNDFYVRNISENAVLITGSFHQSLTDTNDQQFNFDGTASFIWMKINGEWKLNYATVASRLVE